MKKYITFLRAHPQIIILIVWGLAYGWRPWLLGWYHDDWTIFGATHIETETFLTQRFLSLSKIFATRPILLAVYWLTTSILGDNIFLWQWAAIIIVLICAMRLWVFLRLWVPQNELNHPILWIGVIVWLLLPWQVSLTAWVISAFLLLAFWIFIEGAISLHQWFTAQHANFIKPPLLFLLSGLTYEVFLGQSISLFIFLAFTQKNKKKWAELVSMGVLLFISQLWVALWGRLVALILPESFTRNINSSWGLLFIQNVYATIPRMLASISDLKLLTIMVVLVMVGIILDNYRKFSIQDRSHFRKFVGFIGLQVLGSVLIFSLAGYAVSFQGIMARTSIAISLWGISLFVWISSRLRVRKQYWYRGLFSCLILLSATSLINSKEWHDAWILEKAIINATPTALLAMVPQASVVIFDGPYQVGHAPVFAAYWDIDAAMATLYPSSAPIQFTVQRDWYSAWDGQTLFQYEDKNLSRLI